MNCEGHNMDNEIKYNAADEKKIEQEVQSAKPRSYLTLIRRVTFAGLFAALILIATQFKIPTGIGYVNLGDGFILVASFLLGPAAFFPAAIGSGLADLLAGYPIYIPATFVIKGLMGLVAGLLMKNEIIPLPRKIIAFTAAEVIMVAGYFAYESLPFMYGPAAAAGSVIPNLGQAAVGILIGVLLTQILAKQRNSIRAKLQ